MAGSSAAVGNPTRGIHFIPSKSERCEIFCASGVRSCINGRLTLLSIQSLICRTTGKSIRASIIKALNIDHVDGVFPNPDLVLARNAESGADTGVFDACTTTCLSLVAAKNSDRPGLN